MDSILSFQLIIHADRLKGQGSAEVVGSISELCSAPGGDHGASAAMRTREQTLAGEQDTLRQSMGAVLSTFEAMRCEYYGDVRFPVGKYLHGLINMKQIDMDDTTLEYSSFTNSISLYPGKMRENRFIVPESAPCLLAGTGR